MSKQTDKMVGDIIRAIMVKDGDSATEEEMQRAVVKHVACFGLELLDDIRNSMKRQADATERLVKVLDCLVNVIDKK